MSATEPSLPESNADRDGPRLCEADLRVLDRLADHGFDPACLERLSISDRRRGERLLAQLGLLDAYPDGVAADGDARADADLLVDATLARIEREEEARTERMRFGAATGGRTGRGFRLADLVAVASVAIIATTVAIPLLQVGRDSAGRSACANTLRRLAGAFGTYAGDHSGLMPATAGFSLGAVGPRGPWDSLSSWSHHRHGENLAPLVDGGHCGTDDMRCPCDAHQGYGWAYRVPSSVSALVWGNGPRAVLVADRNPLIDLTRRGQPLGTAVLNSENHGGRGQNTLWTDGSIEFLGQPCLHRPGPVAQPQDATDNIWLPSGRPDDLRHDIFLLQ